MTSALRVVSAGGIGMIQDLGRVGMQRFGVPVSGALDSVSLRIANAVVGNADGIAGLEMCYRGPTLQVEADSVRVAAVGAPLEVLAGEQRRLVPSGRSVLLRRGERVAVGACAGTLVAYLAVEGGFALPAFLGSLSTFARAGLGGMDGRPLKKGDGFDAISVAQAEQARRELEARLAGLRALEG